MSARSHGRRSAWLALAMVTSALGGACQVKRTEIVLRVNTDMTQGAGNALSSVRVRVQRGAASPTFARTFVLDGTPTGPFLPADMGIVPFENNIDQPITVSVTAFSGMTELFTHQSTVTFERERTTQLDVFLADRCRDPAAQMCPSGSTCGASGCEPIARPTLPSFTESDASAPRPDSSASADASDTGVSPADSQVEMDTGVPPMDSGVPTDSGVETDTGVPPMDAQMSMDAQMPTDTGVPPRDTGVSPTDTGVAPSAVCQPIMSAPSGMLGALTLNAGTSTLDTDSGALTGATTMMFAPRDVDQGRFGFPHIAVFDFSAITIPTGSTLRIQGSRVAAIVSNGRIEIGGSIDLNGGQGGSGGSNRFGSAGSAGSGGAAGGTINMGCGASGNGAGSGGGIAGGCGSAGGRGGDGTADTGGGGGGGGGCGGGGGAGGSNAMPGTDGATTTVPSGSNGAMGQGTGGGAIGLGCSGATAGGNVRPLSFDSSLVPIAGGSGGGCGGGGGLQGFGGRGGGSGGGSGGIVGSIGGGGAGGGGGGAIVLCGAVVQLTGAIQANGALGGAGAGGSIGESGAQASVTGTNVKSGGGGGGGAGAGGGGGGGAGGSIYIQAPMVNFSGRLEAGGGLGGSGFSVGSGGGIGGNGRNGGSSGGTGGRAGAGARGGDGGRGAIRVLSPAFNNAGGTVTGVLRHDTV